MFRGWCRGWCRQRFFGDAITARSNEKLFELVAERFLLFLRPAHYASADRNRHRDRKHETQFSFHPTVARSAGQFPEHSLIHSSASLEIFQRKIFIRRMRPAILQRQTDQ